MPRPEPVPANEIELKILREHRKNLAAKKTNMYRLEGMSLDLDEELDDHGTATYEWLHANAREVHDALQKEIEESRLVELHDEASDRTLDEICRSDAWRIDQVISEYSDRHWLDIFQADMRGTLLNWKPMIAGAETPRQREERCNKMRDRLHNEKLYHESQGFKNHVRTGEPDGDDALPDVIKEAQKRRAVRVAREKADAIRKQAEMEKFPEFEDEPKEGEAAEPGGEQRGRSTSPEGSRSRSSHRPARGQTQSPSRMTDDERQLLDQLRATAERTLEIRRNAVASGAPQDPDVPDLIPDVEAARRAEERLGRSRSNSQRQGPGGNTGFANAVDMLVRATQAHLVDVRQNAPGGNLPRDPAPNPDVEAVRRGEERRGRSRSGSQTQGPGGVREYQPAVPMVYQPDASMELRAIQARLADTNLNPPQSNRSQAQPLLPDPDVEPLRRGEHRGGRAGSSRQSRTGSDQSRSRCASRSSQRTVIHPDPRSGPSPSPAGSQRLSSERDISPLRLPSGPIQNLVASQSRSQKGKQRRSEERNSRFREDFSP